MLLSNWSARYATCASVSTFRTPSLRQSPAWKSSTLETQISECAVIDRSVNRRSRSSELPLREYQNFCVPRAGVVLAVSALKLRVALNARASFATPGSLSFFSPLSFRTMSLPVTADTSGPSPADAVAGASNASASATTSDAFRIEPLPSPSTRRASLGPAPDIVGRGERRGAPDDCPEGNRLSDTESYVSPATNIGRPPA